MVICQIITLDHHRDNSRSPQVGFLHCSCASTLWTAPVSSMLDIILSSSSVLLSSLKNPPCFHVVNGACVIIVLVFSPLPSKMSFLPEALLDCTGELGTPCHRRASPASGSRRTPRRMEHIRSSTPEKANIYIWVILTRQQCSVNS